MNNSPSKPALISILMPVKNAEPYLHECLDSILNQTYQDWELIAINDHSSDASAAILEQYSQKDSRICWMENNGQGIIDALQTAYQQCSGSYITRMDADDMMSPDKLTKMQAQLEDYGHGHLALGQVQYFSDSELGNGYKRYASWLNQLITTGENWKDLYRECVIPSPCWLVHRYDFDKAGAFDSDRWPEDYDLCFRFYMAGLKCIPSDSILHHWRDYSERTSRNDPHYADNRFLELKCEYFFRMHPRKDQTLVLLGAGKKGKAIAKLINERNIPFRWISNNENKVGKDIYGNKIESQKDFGQINNPCIILAISNPEEQEEIKAQLLHYGLVQGMHFHFFF